MKIENIDSVNFVFDLRDYDSIYYFAYNLDMNEYENTQSPLLKSYKKARYFYHDFIFNPWYGNYSLWFIFKNNEPECLIFNRAKSNLKFSIVDRTDNLPMTVYPVIIKDHDKYFITKKSYPVEYYEFSKIK